MDTITPGRAAAAKLDPVTLAVIRHGVVSIADQIDANITRTAFSPYVYEYKDFAVGFVNSEGHVVAQSTGGMPPFSSWRTRSEPPYAMASRFSDVSASSRVM